MQQFQVNKANPAQARLAQVSPTVIKDNQVLVKIDRFAFTSNNITYAVAGDMLKYWNFFPPAQDSEQWGVIPVWGFADVLESNSKELPVGERLFGYFPPAENLVMTPTRVSDRHFIEGAAHRAELPPAYNMVRRIKTDHNTDSNIDNQRMLLEVLYITGFCLHDLLQDNNWYGAEQVIVISASSKTSIGLAYALDADPTSPDSIGLTSTRNLTTVTSLGIYDQAISYDKLKTIDANKATVIIDMSANTELLGHLHTHLGKNMHKTINVGLTHWNQPRSNQGIIKERSEQFFAPSYITKLISEWGFAEYEKKSTAFFKTAAKRSREWLQVREVSGVQGLANVYPQICEGTLPADTGVIVVM